MEKPKPKAQSAGRKETLAIGFLWFFILLLLFLISTRLYFRLDITGNRANTLSQFSQNLCRNLDDPLVITYFVSGRLAQAYPLPGEISDLLEEYAANSTGMIHFVRRDPQRQGLLREMDDLGILPRQMMITEKNESSLAYVYSGILLEYLDRWEVLPSVFSLDKLEYELSSRILSLVREKNRALGILVGDASKEWETEYGILNRELLTAGFSVRLIETWEEVPPDLYCLFVLGGAEDLDEWALYRIDRFIQTGGGVLFAVNGMNVDFEHGFSVRPPADKGLIAMLAYYGVTLRQALVLDTACLNVRYQIQNPNGSFEINTIRYPHWIAVSSRNGNPLHPVSSDFQGLDLYWASPLELRPPLGVEALSLFLSSGEAWLQTEDFAAAFDQLFLFEEERDETGGTKTLGVSLTGTFPPAFSTDLPAEPAPSRIIVVGNTDFAGILMNATMAEDRNLDFLIKSALWLGGDEGLVSARKPKEESFRLDKIQDPEKKNSARNFSIVINVFVLPFLIIVSGLFITRGRNLRVRKGTLK